MALFLIATLFELVAYSRLAANKFKSKFKKDQLLFFNQIALLAVFFFDFEHLTQTDFLV